MNKVSHLKLFLLSPKQSSLNSYQLCNNRCYHFINILRLAYIPNVAHGHNSFTEDNIRVGPQIVAHDVVACACISWWRCSHRSSYSVAWDVLARSCTVWSRCCSSVSYACKSFAYFAFGWIWPMDLHFLLGIN